MLRVLFTVAFILCCFALSISAQSEIIAVFSVPSDATTATGLYWVGNEESKERLSDERPYLGNSDLENLVSVIHPGAELLENVVPGSSFILRASDFSTRVRVTFTMNPDPQEAVERPYTLRFVNLAMEDRDGPHPLELKHSDAGYIWIDPMEYVEHITAHNHVFEIRDKEHTAVFQVSIRDGSEEL
jgi:hypothetical protein